MKIENFNKLKTLINKQLEWNEENLLEKQVELGRLYQRYQDIFFNERIQYENLLSEKDRIYGKLYDKYKFNSDKSWESKSEIESQIKCDDEYYGKCIECNEQAAIVEYLEGTLKNISSIAYHIKDFIKWKMFKEGVGY